VTTLSKSSFGRRAFIGVAAGALAGVAVPEVVHAAVAAPADTDAPARKAAPAGFAARAAGPSNADWTALAHDLSGTLVRPGEAGYGTDKLLFDPRFDSQQPAGIAYVKSPHDVATCIAFVRKFKIPFSTRSGGHSDGGYSGNTGGLIVDVQNFRNVNVSGSTVSVGTGTRLVDFYNGLAAKGRAVPGGSCPTVGIAGLTLGGGIGVTARAYGLTCDFLEEVQIVTADGSILNINASPQNHGDLFWACQGGGGGNFGVTTSFTFRTTPAPSPCTFYITWPWSSAAHVVAGWQAWAPSGPDQLWSNMHLSASPGHTPSISLGGTYLGSYNDLLNLVGRLYGLIGRQFRPTHAIINRPQSYLSVMLYEAGCSSIGYQACHLPWYAPGGKLVRVPQLTKSDFFTRPLSSGGISSLLRGVQAFSNVRGGNGAAGGIAFDALGGAVNRVAASATAFVHRNTLFDAQYTTNWNPSGTTQAEINNQHAWIRGFWGSMRGYASGQAYQNYIDPEQPNWQQAYYGSNYPRLQQIKLKYDPTRVFNFAQAIVPAAAPHESVPVTG